MLPYQCPLQSAVPRTFPIQQQLPHMVLSHWFFSFLTFPAGCTLLPQCLGWYLHPFPVCLVGHPNMDSLTKASPKGITSSFQSKTSCLTRNYGFTTGLLQSLQPQPHKPTKEANSFQVSAAWKAPHFHGIYENPSWEGDLRVSHCVLVQRGWLLSQEVAPRWQCLEGQCGLGTAWSSGSGALYQLISQTFTNSN